MSCLFCEAVEDKTYDVGRLHNRLLHLLNNSDEEQVVKLQAIILTLASGIHKMPEQFFPDSIHHLLLVLTPEDEKESIH